MTQSQLGLLPLAVLMLSLGEQARAWTCEPPGELIAVNGERLPTDEEIMRHRSIGIADVIASTLRNGDIVVFGRFSRNASIPFLHEEQLEGIRARYWPPTEDVQMPYQIEYYYVGAYDFEGHKLENATLVPFESEAINARVSISEEYEGVVDLLPETEVEVIGVLRSGHGGRTLELTTSICPSYHRIGSAQMSDLLECYRDEACR